MRLRPIWTLTLFGGMISAALAAVTPAADLDKMTQTSTWIVVGELTSVQRDIRAATVDVNTQRINVRMQRGTFRIDQILKGDHYACQTVRTVCRLPRRWKFSEARNVRRYDRD